MRAAIKAWRKFFVAFVILCLSVTVALSQKNPPRFLNDKGACPFECCTYRRWKTEKATKLYQRPDVRSRQVGRVSAGSAVTALTGEVHTIPSRFLVKKAHGRYRPGDVLWVYTYHGEGFFKVWYKGRMYTEDLLFSPYGGSAGKRCEESPDCWGVLDKELQFTWWIKIKVARRVSGWTNQAENFSGADACG